MNQSLHVLQRQQQQHTNAVDTAVTGTKQQQQQQKACIKGEDQRACAAVGIGRPCHAALIRTWRVQL
jgi:hypothetical protein